MSTICILGPSGRTGGQVVDLVADHDELELIACVDGPDSVLIGREIVPGVVVSTDVAAAIAAAEVYIDFTTPAATTAAAQSAAASRTAAVIGTTGLDAAAIAAIAALAEVAPVVTAPNFSLGVNLLFGLAESAARALGRDFDLEIVELHHNQKRDAPSGTAIALGQALAAGRDIAFAEHRRYARDGEVGARPPDEIGIVAVRGGDIVGEHTAYLIGANERIEITHRAGNRAIFAAGALRAAAWAVGKPAGHYTMKQVLGL